MADSRPTINDLPLQIISQVLAPLTFKQRQGASLVSKRFYEAAQDVQFLEKTLLKIKSTCRNWDKLAALEKRRIPNLEITFKKYGEISPEIAHHVRLASHVKHLTLSSAVNASSVSFCIRHFKNLQTIKLHPGHFDLFSFFFDDDFGKKWYKSLPMSPKMVLIVPYSYKPKELCRLLNDLSGVKHLTLERCERMGSTARPIPPLNGDFVVNLFRREDRARSLQELDLSWIYVESKNFKDLVSIPHLKLRSLKYASTQDGTQKLMALAQSSSPLRSLEVFCREEDCFDVRLSVLQTVLAMKPSITSLKVDMIKYHHDVDINGILGDIFTQCPEISKLHIEEGNYRDNSDTALKFMKSGRHGQLTTLVIRPHEHVAAWNVFEDLAKNSPHLKVLFVESLKCVSDGLLSMVGRSFPELERLKITGSSLKGIELSDLKNLSNLRVLYIKRCRDMTDDCLEGLSLPCLEQLWVTDSDNITDKAVMATVSSHLSLQLLSVADCPQITDRSVGAITKHLKHLRCLVLSGCRGITSKAAKNLLQCHHLQYLDVSCCNKQFEKAMYDLRSSMMFLQYLVHHCGDVDDKVLVRAMETEWGFASLYFHIWRRDAWDKF